MKRSRSFLSKLTLVAAAVSATLAAPEAHAGAMHTDVSFQTYTDFGQNKGRYATGGQVNALLDYIRREVDGGIKITYANGKEGSFVIPYAQGMIDFRGTYDSGADVAISPTFVATVHHNGSNDASYGHRTVGGNHAINYKAIDIRGSETFRLWPEGTGNDYMLQRQSKLQTDASWNPVTNITDMSQVEGDYLYHSGGGTMQLYVPGSGFKGLMGPYNYIIGGINKITSAVTHEGTTNISVCINTQYYLGWGACTENPLPNAIRGGDSGSPTFIYNEETQRYEYIAAMQSALDTFGQARGNVEWTHETLESFNVNVDMSAEGVTNNTIYLNAITTEVETKTDNNGNSGTIWSGKITTDAAGEIALQRTDAEGNTTDVTYKGIKNGWNTWADLSDVKDNENWYAYEGHLERSIPELFFNENLVFSSADGVENSIVLNADVDLGVGYVEFKEGSYTISSATGENGTRYQLDSAGYVLNKGAEVHVQLTNTDTVTAEDGTTHTRMTEWRAMGEGGSLY